MKLGYLIALITASGLASAVPVDNDNGGLDLGSILGDVTQSSNDGPTSSAASKATTSAAGGSESSDGNDILNGLTSVASASATASATPSARASLSPSSSSSSSSLSASSDTNDSGSILQDILSSGGPDIESLVLNVNFTNIYEKLEHSGLLSKAKNYVSNFINDNDNNQS